MLFENIVEVGLDATTQQSVNVAAASMNEFTPLTNDEPSEIDYVAFWSCWNLELFLDNYFCCYFGGCQCWFGRVFSIFANPIESIIDTQWTTLGKYFFSQVMHNKVDIMWITYIHNGPSDSWTIFNFHFMYCINIDW